MAKPRWAPNRTLLQSTVSAARGFGSALSREKKVRQVLVGLVVATGACLWADVEGFRTFMVAFGWVTALICEIFNTALEKALDYSSGKEFHPLVCQGKDYASACTFISLIFAGSLTFYVLMERLS